MFFDEFWRIAKSGICPKCSGNNTKSMRKRFGGSSYTDFLYCNDCSGIPAMCNFTVYIHKNIDSSMAICEQCGQEGSTMDHAFAFPGDGSVKW